MLYILNKLERKKINRNTKIFNNNNRGDIYE